MAGPLLASWRARNETEAKLITAEGEAKVLRIHAEAQAEARQLLNGNDVLVRGEIEVADAVKQRIEYQEHKRHTNIVSVVRIAAKQLENTHVPEVEPDHDWTARFFGTVQDVSSEQMQVFWGQVLARQIEQPGTTSMRTLDILRNLDGTTAKVFARFCSAAVYLIGPDGQVGDARVPSLGGNASDNALAPFGFHFGALNRLNEHGLIISDYNSYSDYEWVENERYGGADPNVAELHHQGTAWNWVSEAGEPKKTVTLHGVAMTVSGRELSRVVSLEPMPEYTERLRQFLLERFKLSMNPGPAA